MSANLLFFFLGFVGMFVEILLHGGKTFPRYIKTHWDTVIVAAIVYCAFALSWWAADISFMADMINDLLGLFLSETFAVTFEPHKLNPVTFLVGVAFQAGVNTVAMRLKKWHEPKDKTK